MVMRSSSRWMWASLVLTLVLGGCLGLALERYLLRGNSAPEPPRWGDQHWSIWFDCDWVPVAPDPEEVKSWRTGRVDRLRDALGLDADQVKQMELTLERYDLKSRDNWSVMRNSYCGIRDELRSDLRAVLREEQVAPFERYVEQIDERAKRYLNRGSEPR
jgi:hypothetical protein